MSNKLNRVLVTLSLCGLSSLAVAQSSNCSSALSAYESAVLSGYPTSGNGSPSYIQANHPECFASGSTTSTIEINATSFAQALSISRAISSRLMPLADGPVASAGVAGLAAGGKFDSWNIWGSIDQNNSDFSYRNAAATTTKGGNDVTTSIVGFDYALSPGLVVGISAAFDRADGYGTTPGNSTTTNTDGYQIAPYVGYQLSKELALDASVGLGKGNFSNSAAVSAEADRWFAAANLTYAKWINNIQLTGKASYLHGEEEYGNSKIAGITAAKTGSTNKLDQMRLGVQAGYWMNGVMPFVGVAYTSDISRSNTAPGSSNALGRDAFVWSIGANFFSLSSKVTGGISYQVESNRTHSDNEILTANINFRF